MERKPLSELLAVFLYMQYVIVETLTNVQAGITVTKINGIPYAYNEFCLSLPREIISVPLKSGRG